MNKYYVQTVNFVKQNNPTLGYRAETMQLFAGLLLNAWHSGKPDILLLEGREALNNIFQLAEMSEET